MAECMLCGAPGGYPYCNRECEDADQDDTGPARRGRVRCRLPGRPLAGLPGGLGVRSEGPTHHRRGDDVNEHEAVELFFDAVVVPDNGHYDRQTGEVDMQASDIVKALLEAGWAPPGKTSARDHQPVEVHGPSYGEPRIGMFRPLEEETR